MKCVCTKRCQATTEHQGVVTFRRGQVYDFKKCPPHFKPIEGEEAVAINFDTASEDELMEAEYDLDDLKEYIQTKYDRNPHNRGKEKTVEMLLDCRYRSINVDLNKVL